ncbi:MAG: hypothetical protein KC549_05390 [Myxococcales bacterium]|nr:hypothetical protein [Myxococcales bacterium]MCB9545101.1 hypothetical protein [Myxococcales bacterium]
MDGFHLDRLQHALVGAALSALEEARPSIAYLAFALPDEDDALLPHQLLTGRDTLELRVEGEGGVPAYLSELPAIPALAALSSLCGLPEDALAFDGGLAGDLILITLIDAAEAVAAGAEALRLTGGRVPFGYREPDEADLLDDDAREVIWEDVADQLRGRPRACKLALAAFFYDSDDARAHFLERVGLD